MWDGEARWLARQRYEATGHGTTQAGAANEMGVDGVEVGLSALRASFRLRLMRGHEQAALHPPTDTRPLSNGIHFFHEGLKRR